MLSLMPGTPGRRQQIRAPAGRFTPAMEAPYNRRIRRIHQRVHLKDQVPAAPRARARSALNEVLELIAQVFRRDQQLA